MTTGEHVVHYDDLGDGPLAVPEGTTRVRVMTGAMQPGPASTVRAGRIDGPVTAAALDALPMLVGLKRDATIAATAGATPQPLTVADLDRAIEAARAAPPWGYRAPS